MRQANFRIYRKILTILLVLFLSASAYAQQITVKGTVKDQTGEPAIGANVLIKGTSNGVITDVDGKFELSTDKNAVLVISYVGYANQEVQVTGKPLMIILKEDSELLDEVVVLGYGANSRKQDLSAAVGVLSNTEELTTRPVSSTESMLQGQLAGVTVQANGGDPTATPTITIRGQGSYKRKIAGVEQGGDNVLWVVDGVPGAPIASMSDIESIVVLKDAASAAIYGAQSGAGGVILVTTKKAKAGTPTLSYEGTYGVRQATNLPEPLNAEGELEMRKRSYANADMSLPDGWDVAKNPWIGTTRTNWMDEIFRTAFYQRHNIALNVGTENFSSRLSFSFDNDEGVLINTYNKNYSIRYNGKFDLNKWVSISEDFVWKNTESRTKDTDDAYTGPVLSAIYMPASATVYNPLDGTWGGTTTEDPEYIAKYGSNFAGAHGDAVNPVRLLKAENRFNRTSDVWSTTSLQIANVLQGLKFTSRFTYNLKSNNYKNFRPIQDEPGKPNNSNNMDITNYRRDAWKTENTLTYDNTFGRHTVGALFSTTADHFVTRGLDVNGKNFTDESPYLQYLAYAGSTSATDYMTGPDANVSLVARLAYSYDDRYFATASWRRDYAGRLPKENNFGDFPAVTLAWKISNEKFFKKNDFISLLKLRASWGRVGNLGSINYNYKSLLLGTTYWQEQAQYGVMNNTTWNNFVYNSTAMNKNLTWETSEQYDLGLDVEMFNSRLSLSFDYFDKRTFNLIQEQTMDWPSTIGLDPMLINQGEVRNRGFEISANWSDRINKNFSYFVSGNFSYLKNWVSDIGVKNADGTLCKTKGIGAYWALFTDVLDTTRLDRLVKELDNPATFKRKYRIPSLSADNPKYKDNGRYWQGGIWPGTNYMVMQGLVKKGYRKLAREISLNHYSQVLEVFKKTGTFWEYYAPESAEPGFMARKEFVGWTGLPPIAELIEFIIGIQGDYATKQIVWDMNLTETNGIERYPFGPDGVIGMKAEARRSASDEPHITVDSNIEFELLVLYGGKEKRIQVTPGKHTY